MPGRDRACDASHFPSELEVIPAGRDAVSVADGDDRHTKQECDQNDEENRMRPGSHIAGHILRDCRRVRPLAILHEQKTSTAIA